MITQNEVRIQSDVYLRIEDQRSYIGDWNNSCL